MKIQNENVHHGARFIDAKSISQLIPGIDNIGNDIRQFRSVAYNHNKRLESNKHSSELNNLAPERFNNTISIIGQRGDGKTSAMMTFIEEIKKGTYFRGDNRKDDGSEGNNKCDIVTRIIDPDEIGKSSDLFGWVMACIGEYLESYSKGNQNEDKYYQDCIHLQGMHQKTSNLNAKLNNIHKLYTSSKKEYSDFIYSKSNSLNEYSDKFKTMLTNDYQFSQNFRNLITEIINFKREENDRLGYKGIEVEPLIYFFFDDVGFSFSNNKADINDYYFCNSEIKTNYVYAYLSVFGKNVRSFVNVYNYLYSEAISICQNQNKKNGEKQTISEYWNTDRFSEFINIIIESKFTYLKHRSDINKFLSIKYDKIDNSNNSEYNVRNLRIDCEELEILVDKILDGEKKTVLNDKQGEINSLIMLAVFINEVFYHIHRKNYQHRYTRIVYKLKNILCKVLVNAQNEYIQLLPTTLDLQRTLCIYYRIISRMGIETLNKIVYPDFNSMNSVSRITTKKYFVQLYYAIILLVTAGESKQALLKDTKINQLINAETSLINCIKVNELYDLYEKSTYQESILFTENGMEIKRDDLEKIIIQYLKKFFDIHRDTNWFNDKVIYVENMYPSVDSIMSIIEKKYLNNYLKHIDSIVIDDIVNIKKSIYKLNDNGNIFADLIALLNERIEYNCEINNILLNSSEKVALIKSEIEYEKLNDLFLYGFVGKRKNINGEADKYYQTLMKFKQSFEIKLKSYLNAAESRNKIVINYKLKDQEKIIKRNIEIYYLLVFIIEYVVSYNMDDAKFFLNLKKEMVIDE